ncbi:hypothetical protein J5N97_006331 [Dioscorea zingiberensis]|uniref:Endonuclease/exonuclease/phosphatase domain-containing protein n=1 Tax=Dioscorea zingiberensis TaxID=325984 RepID=A0A9D5HSN9_9LILI|nr:hypothetical protein J5N97_006331 [Dioscorea zingiberensis]
MDSIKIISWNCRGISNPKTFSKIRALMRSHQPDLVCLVETRADANQAIKVCNKFSKLWEWAAIHARGMSGGIITLWKYGVGKVTPIAQSRYALHLILSTDKPRHWVLSVIYNSQNVQYQKVLWRDLSHMSSLSLPWVLVGDFNAILSIEEHRGGRFDRYAVKSKLFSEFMSVNHLLDLGFYGTAFTWCNN